MPRSLIALALVGVVLVTVWGFQPEATALAWHLRHGMHTEGAGVRIRVPLWFDATASPDAITLTTHPGNVRQRFHAPSALILLSDKKANSQAGTPVSNAEMLQRMQQSHERLGTPHTTRRELRLGSQTVTCLEFEGGPVFSGTEVWCAPAEGGPIVSFGGSPQLANEFYNLLQAAERVGR